MAALKGGKKRDRFRIPHAIGSQRQQGGAAGNGRELPQPFLVIVIVGVFWSDLPVFRPSLSWYNDHL
eukprot:COSAG06_NODE_90_length_24779_cov_33.515843_30_plen_67_part_00